MRPSHQHSMPHASRRQVQSITDIVAAIGSSTFDETAISFIDYVCGAEHCAFFRLESGALTRLANMGVGATGHGHRLGDRYVFEQHWRRDPMILDVRDRAAASSSLAVARVVPQNYSDPSLREIYRRVGERVIVGRGVPNQQYIDVLSILRLQRRGPFGQHDVGRISQLGDLLLTIVAKHAEITLSSMAPTPLNSLAHIERCIASAPQTLSAREKQVCARILRGSTTPQIAAELGIGVESVATYRKRAYRQLEVSSRHELLTWYFEQWQQQKSAV